MTWTQIAYGIGACVSILWVFWRAEQQFHAGYRKALEHLEEMTRPKRTPIGRSYNLEDALTKLREETKR